MIIAIDGPAGAGKSTIARKLAEKLGYGYVDTGAMYRAVTWSALDAGMDLTNEAALGRLAEQSQIDLSDSKILIDGRNVTHEIRLPDVGDAVSIVSSAKGVRACLVAKQRSLADAFGDLVIEGRDIGTVVFPDADIKIFLTASHEARSERRLNELRSKGVEVEAAVIEKELTARDSIDSKRAVSPLAKAKDAHLVDTTNKSIEEVVESIMALVAV